MGRLKKMAGSCLLMCVLARLSKRVRPEGKTAGPIGTRNISLKTMVPIADCGAIGPNRHVPCAAALTLYFLIIQRHSSGYWAHISQTRRADSHYAWVRLLG